jgi:hypothetical protein
MSPLRRFHVRCKYMTIVLPTEWEPTTEVSRIGYAEVNSLHLLARAGGKEAPHQLAPVLRLAFGSSIPHIHHHAEDFDQDGGAEAEFSFFAPVWTASSRSPAPLLYAHLRRERASLTSSC